MSEIIKTEAIVLNKLNYGDTSSIVSLFTKDNGRLSALIKGGRSPKSKIGLIVDPLNHLQIIIYNKDTRDLQILSGADIISHFPKLKEDFDKLKYSYAVIELLKKLTAEHESHVRLFNGSVRILSLMESSNEHPALIFGRYFIFFLKEIGYEIQLDSCCVCGRTNLKGTDLGYNFEMGILCEHCRVDHLETYSLSAELFTYIICLKSSKKIETFNTATAEKAIIFMERYLKYHIPDFSGIQSLQLLK